MLVLDDASFHHTKRVGQMCSDAEVKLLCLPPYSPDLNPIEEMFAELRAFIKRNWKVHEEDPELNFDTYLDWCIDIVGARKQSAEGHFDHAGITLEPPPLSYDGIHQ